MKVIDQLKNSSTSMIRRMLTEATVKTGIFKRRMIHVAKRFGALKRWVDFSNISIRSLMKSFEGTVIYDEALKEVFTKDLDLKNTLRVFDAIRQGEIEVMKLETDGVATPIARVGIERVSMKTDLIPPERMRGILVRSARVRLLDETRTFICTKCLDYIEMIRIKDLPERPVCPRCGSGKLGLLRAEVDKAISLIEKRGEKLRKDEKKLMGQAVNTAKLLSKFGKAAAVALAGRRIRVSDAEEILSEETELTDRFFELVIEAEREALKRRFW